ncbi:M91 family zinc metallopeptidase [Pedobacter antarcticus]|uniref:M91 family zinc metallopeptidase n=1 Tax=Pedobacter antarcticus TaxID=34086 RepID=UPI003741F2D5
MDAAFDKKKGGSGSEIAFDPNDPGKLITNADGSKGRPAQIGLAHEFGHAKDRIGEKATRERSIVRDPDGNARVFMTNVEINVRKNIQVIRNYTRIGKMCSKIPVPPLRTNVIDHVLRCCSILIPYP